MLGYSLVHFLTFLCISSICLASILKTEFLLYKKMKNDISQEHLDISVNHCLSGIMAFSNNSTKIQGINFNYWHNSLDSLNDNTKKIIINKIAKNRMARDSVILETIQVNLPIYFRSVSKKNLEYMSSFKFALNKTPDLYNSFLLLNPWGDIVINSKSSIRLNNENQTILRLLLKPSFITFLGTQNYNLSQISKDIENSNWIIPIDTYGIIYHTTNNTLEYLSLITSDRQPICENLSSFTRINNRCQIESSSKSLKSNTNFFCKNPTISIAGKIEALDKWK